MGETIPHAPIHHAIDIHASPAAVWRVFTDLTSWPRWFPEALSARSLAEPTWQRGGTLEVEMAVPVLRSLTLHLRIEEVEAERKVRWIGKAWGVSGDHSYIFEDRGQWTRVTSHEKFAGLVTLLPRVAGAKVRERVDGLAHASMARLKALVEDAAGA